jgi:FG-GAP repeat
MTLGHQVLRALPVIILLARSLLPEPAQAQFNQQAKLVGTGFLGHGVIVQGSSVSLSNDGTTAIVGGYQDNNNLGAAWVFTREAGIWSQQAKLVAIDSIGSDVEQGYSVSLSGDGNTAIVGGRDDNNLVGAAWVYSQSGGMWSQQAKLVGTSGSGEQGWSVSLSSDGNTAIVGAYNGSMVSKTKQNPFTYIFLKMSLYRT